MKKIPDTLSLRNPARFIPREITLPWQASSLCVSVLLW